MKHILPCIFALLLLTPFVGNSQDMHWTLFNYSPLSLNPANTGNYLGTYRVSGIIRDASFGINNTSSSGTSNVFKSFGVGIDAPIALGFRKQDWIGVGAMFFGDRSGDIGLGLSYSSLSVAYHFADKKRKKIFTIGIQGGGGSRGANNWQNVKFEDDTQVLSIPNDPQDGGLQPINFFDLNFGLSYRAEVNKQTKIHIGATANQLAFSEEVFVQTNANNQSKRDSGFVYRPVGIGLHGTFDFQLDKKWDLSPSFRMQTQGPALEMQVQGMMGLRLNPDKETKLKFGLGYRIGDAAQILLGMDFKDVRVAMAYDLTLSQITAIDNNLGGFELGVIYVGKIYKEPKIKPVILCPRY